MKNLSIYINESILSSTGSGKNAYIPELLKQMHLNPRYATIHEDGSVSYNGDVNLGLYYDEHPFDKLPLRFKKITNGDFILDECKELKTLDGCPEEVARNFSCDNTSIETLEGGPSVVGQNYSCHECQNLKSLEGAPRTIPGFLDVVRCYTLKEVGKTLKHVKRDVYADYDSDEFKMQLKKKVKVDGIMFI